MDDQHFERPDDIFDFVFKECADTNVWVFDFSEEPRDKTILDYEITINKPMIDYRYIYYADKLLKEKFNMSIESLSIVKLGITENDFQDVLKIH